jgi:hypothetical protein
VAPTKKPKKKPPVSCCAKPVKQATKPAKAKRPAKPKPKAIKVALKDINRVCEACGKVSATVTSHNYTTKNYKGPCGDSFCYATCDLSACKPVTARVCTSCFEDKAVPIAD